MDGRLSLPRSTEFPCATSVSCGLDVCRLKQHRGKEHTEDARVNLFRVQAIAVVSPWEQRISFLKLALATRKTIAVKHGRKMRQLVF
jgi:hypothetical protein